MMKVWRIFLHSSLRHILKIKPYPTLILTLTAPHLPAAVLPLLTWKQLTVSQNNVWGEFYKSWINLCTLLRHGNTIKEKCTKNTLNHLTSTIKTHLYCSCSSPTSSTLHSLYTTWQSALRTQNNAIQIQSTIRVRDCPERSRSLSKSYVLRERKCWYHVASGMCEFKHHG
jgi:hypothetical protein